VKARLKSQAADHPGLDVCDGLMPSSTVTPKQKNELSGSRDHASQGNSSTRQKVWQRLHDALGSAVTSLESDSMLKDSSCNPSELATLIEAALHSQLGHKS